MAPRFHNLHLSGKFTGIESGADQRTYGKLSETPDWKRKDSREGNHSAQRTAWAHDLTSILVYSSASACPSGSADQTMNDPQAAAHLGSVLWWKQRGWKRSWGPRRRRPGCAPDPGWRVHRCRRHLRPAVSHDLHDHLNNNRTVLIWTELPAWTFLMHF